MGGDRLGRRLHLTTRKPVCLRLAIADHLGGSKPHHATESTRHRSSGGRSSVCLRATLLLDRDLTSDTNVNFANMLAGTIANRTLFDAAAGRPAYSNVMAVAPGNVSPVPVPAAAWLFGSGLVGLGSMARARLRKGQAVAQKP